MTTDLTWVAAALAWWAAAVRCGWDRTLVESVAAVVAENVAAVAWTGGMLTVAGAADGAGIGAAAWVAVGVGLIVAAWRTHAAGQEQQTERLAAAVGAIHHDAVAAQVRGELLALRGDIQGVNAQLVAQFEAAVAALYEDEP